MGQVDGQSGARDEWAAGAGLDCACAGSQRMGRQCNIGRVGLRAGSRCGCPISEHASAGAIGSCVGRNTSDRRSEGANATVIRRADAFCQRTEHHRSTQHHSRSGPTILSRRRHQKAVGADSGQSGDRCGQEARDGSQAGSAFERAPRSNSQGACIASFTGHAAKRIGSGAWQYAGTQGHGADSARLAVDDAGPVSSRGAEHCRSALGYFSACGEIVQRRRREKAAGAGATVWCAGNAIGPATCDGKSSSAIFDPGAGQCARI